MRSLILWLAVFAASAFAQGSIFPSKAQKDAARHLEPAAVSEEARALLREKMKNHGKEMKELSVAVTTVKLDEAKRLAKLVADEPRLDPAAGPAMKLPKRFFEIQEREKAVAQELSDAAAADDVFVTEQKFEQLVQQCVSCHTAFRRK